VQHLFSHIPEAVLSVVGSALALLLHKAIKEIRSLIKALGETQIKAELAYDEVSQRVPEVKIKFEFWKAHR
jgi:hypothetical protein